VHGYASTDPAIPSDAPPALEFVYVLVDMPRFAPNADQRQVGKWRLTVDDAKDMSKAFNEQARQNHAALALSVRGYTLAQDTVVATPQPGKLAQLQKLQDRIATSFESEGFDGVSEAAFKAKSGMTIRDMLEKAQGTGTPFGWKRSAPVKFAPFARVMINQRRPACARNDGAFAAYIVAVEPLAGAAADFGQVAVLIMGMGICSRTSSGAVRQFVAGLLDEASDEVLEELGKP
jgi:hypothetical protein